jgi:hypothetical protein
LKNETPEKNRFQKEIDYASQLHQQEREELWKNFNK